MTTKTTMIHELILNEEELKAIEVLEPMLAEIQNHFGEVNILQAVETGEVVEVEEIARVRGILGFLYAHRAVEVI